MTAAKRGIIVGVLLSAASYFVYIALLHEPDSLFYGFAALVFFGCPLIAGIIATSNTHKHKLMQKQFFACSGLVFSTTLLLFIVTYAVLPQFDRANVQLPASCDGFHGMLDLPSQLAYALPDGKGGILLAESPESVVAATIDGDRSPFASTAYLIRKSDNAILREMPFDNDVVMASIDGGILYIYNDKLGYLIDERTGDFEHNLLLMDNYGGLHRKVRNQRADFLHKLSKRLVDRYSLIAIEKLHVKGLAGGMLAKSVNDAGWTILTNMLDYKAEEAGSKIVSVDPSCTSQTCPQCGSIRKKELSERWHKCDCGFECHRDVAAALVILARGLSCIGIQSLEATRL